MVPFRAGVKAHSIRSKRCIYLYTIQSLSAVTIWIAHMGIWCVKVQPAFRPDRGVFRMARGSDCTNIPLAAGRLERTGPFFVAAFEAMQSIGSSTRIGRG